MRALCLTPLQHQIHEPTPESRVTKQEKKCTWLRINQQSMIKTAIINIKHRLLGGWMGQRHCLQTPQWREAFQT